MSGERWPGNAGLGTKDAWGIQTRQGPPTADHGACRAVGAACGQGLRVPVVLWACIVSRWDREGR